MTREEIMQMEERELYYRIGEIVGHGHDALNACWLAEEKIKGMGPGKWAEYGDTLWSLIKNYPYERNIDGRDIATIHHIEPQITARAILLTVEVVDE